MLEKGGQHRRKLRGGSGGRCVEKGGGMGGLKGKLAQEVGRRSAWAVGRWFELAPDFNSSWRAY
jgi:hypothetical protein